MNTLKHTPFLWQKIKKLLSENKPFFIPFIVLWICLGVLLIILRKSTIHLFINQWHCTSLDLFFKYITNLGDGLTPAFLAVFLILFISYRKGFIIGGGAILGGVLAQFLKRTVFYDVVRPKAYFNNIADLYLIPGVDVHTRHSFPSGHATTAFTLFFVLACFSKNKTLKFFCFIGALITAFSRVYLSQHFLSDIYFGAILGIISAIASIAIFTPIAKDWMDKSLVNLFNR